MQIYTRHKYAKHERLISMCYYRNGRLEKCTRAKYVVCRTSRGYVIQKTKTHRVPDGRGAF